MTILDDPAAVPAPVEARTLGQRIGFRSGVTLVSVGNDYELRHPWGRHRLGGLAEAEVQLLQRMVSANVDAFEIAGSRLRPLLLTVTNLISVTLTNAGQPLLTAVPVSRAATVLALRRPPGLLCKLSRFSYLHSAAPEPVAGKLGMVVESPLSAHRIELHDSTVAAFISALATPIDLEEAALRAGIGRDVATVIASILAATNLLNDRDEAYPLWEFQDLLFHQRSRYGLHDYPAGGQFSHADRAHASALPEVPTDAVTLDLQVPDWDRVHARDLSLTAVIESRGSSRSYAEVITGEQLGELLYRSARVRSLRWTTGEHPYESVDRPYPTGGGMGELEIYLAVHHCQSVPAGVYWYDSAGHRLVLRNDDAEVRAALAAQAWLATGGQTDAPQVQLFVTSRLERLQWKYNAISYALTLKHVGVLFQTLYLVSTAMGLSACGNGSGDTELLQRAAKLELGGEAPVGEFLLGGSAVEVRPPVTGFTDVVADHR